MKIFVGRVNNINLGNLGSTNFFFNFWSMYTDDYLKWGIEAARFRLKDDLDLLIIIFDDAKEIAHSKMKAAKHSIDKINDDYFKRKKDSLNDEDQKIHQGFYNYAFHFDSVALHSLFVSSYSFFEHFIMEVCEKFERYSTINIKLKNISKTKSDLDRMMKFLYLIHNLENAKLENSWLQTLFKFQKIRNLIVHHYDQFTNDSKQVLIDFLGQYDTFIRHDFDFKINDRKFLMDFKDAVVGYSEDLLDEVFKIQIINA